MNSFPPTNKEVVEGIITVREALLLQEVFLYLDAHDLVFLLEDVPTCDEQVIALLRVLYCWIIAFPFIFEREIVAFEALWSNLLDRLEEKTEFEYASKTLVL